MNAQLAIMAVTLRRLITRKRIIGLILFASIPALVVLFASTGDRGPERLANLYHDTTYGILIAVALPVIAIVNATGALGDERRSHTMPFLALKPIPRWSIALSTTIASVGATLAVAFVAVVLGWLVAGFATDSWDIGKGPAVGALVAAIGYGTIFVPIGLLTRRATVIGLIYLFLWESSFANAVATLAPTSLNHIALSAYVDLAPDISAADALGSLEPGAGTALTKVAVVALVSLAITTWALNKRDLA
ncbi:MAG: ABC transporter permease [Acidimicrobiia bacterium]|nr:ABC transporter permease [Acidimicrobiia bacterium]